MYVLRGICPFGKIHSKLPWHSLDFYDESFKKTLYYLNIIMEQSSLVSLNKSALNGFTNSPKISFFLLSQVEKKGRKKPTKAVLFVQDGNMVWMMLKLTL